MKKFAVIIGFMLILALFAPAAQAQQPLTLKNVLVNLWPEYDDPGMLVIYHLTLPSSASLPTDVQFKIPAAAGLPNAVAVRQPDGSLLTTQYETSGEGQWTVLNITATTPELQIEYYDPNLKKDGASRSFEFLWPGDYAVEAFQMEVQQPAGASQMRLPGNFKAGPATAEGLVLHTADIGALPAGQPLNIELGYQKADDSLTVSSQPVEPAAPIQSSKSGMISVLPWVLGILGVALIAGALLWYWRTSTASGQRRKRSKSPDQHRRKSGTEKATPAAAGPVYCHQCGNRAGAGDRFCRVCGAELRN